jgi:hypothetical protein
MYHFPTSPAAPPQPHLPRTLPLPYCLLLLAPHTWFLVEPAPPDLGQDSTLLHLSIEPTKQVLKSLAWTKLHFSHIASPPDIQFGCHDYRGRHFTPSTRLRQVCELSHNYRHQDRHRCVKNSIAEEGHNEESQHRTYANR